MPLWWNGRRDGLKIRFREEWGFKSLQGHHLQMLCLIMAAIAVNGRVQPA
jgi:hypothetical protein